MSDTRARIALFVADLEGGGAQRRMVDLARAFAARGHSVDVLAVRPRGPLRESLSAPLRLVSLDRWWTRLPGVAGSKRRRVMASALSVAAYLRKERPAALLATSHSVNVGAALAGLLARVPTRVALRIDSQLSRAPELAGSRTQRRRISRARRFFTRADLIIAISRGVADDVARVTGFPEERIFAIHNPAFRPEIIEAAREPVAHPWFDDGGPPILLAVGRLVAQKDFATLVRAFARLRATRPLRLLVLGEGPERAALEALADELGVRKHLDLPGFVDNPFPFMARAALLVMSSAWEGFGNVLVEAMACGCPVVSTDCPSGPAEILDGGLFGGLAPVGDEAALAGAMAAALATPPDRTSLRERAGTFSLDRIADRYLEVLLRPSERAHDSLGVGDDRVCGRE